MFTKPSTLTQRSAPVRAAMSILAVASMLIVVLVAHAPGADAQTKGQVAEEQQHVRSEVDVMAFDFGGQSAPGESCPFNALGVPYACYGYVPVQRDGSCPTGSVLDGDGLCRKPLPNAPYSVCLDSNHYIVQGPWCLMATFATA